MKHRSILAAAGAALTMAALSTPSTADATTIHHRCAHQPHGHAYGWAKQHYCFTTPETEPGVRRDFPITIIKL